MTSDRPATTKRLGILGLRTLTVAAFAAAAPTSAALADAWGDTQALNIPGTGPHPDGGSEWYCYGPSLPTHLEDNVDAGMDAIEDSDATVVFNTNCPTWIDIRFEEDDLGVAGRYGITVCDAWNSAGSQCDRNIATLDVDEIRDAVDPQSDVSRAFAYTMVACHEAGHGVGNTHYGNTPGAEQENQADCMRSGLLTLNNPSASTFHNYSAHHKNHLNGWF